jgi:hypothetical protein
MALIQSQLKEYKPHTEGGELGGEQYNILMMSRKKRASYAFDKKGPLADFPEDVIRSGQLALG